MKKRIISLVLCLALFLQMPCISAFATEGEPVLPQSVVDTDVQTLIESVINGENVVKSQVESAADAISQLFGNADSFDEYLNIIFEYRNDFESRFDFYKTELLNKVGVTETEFAVFEGADKCDALIMALYVKNTELTVEDALMINASFETKLSKYDALEVYFLCKDEFEGEDAAAWKEMLLDGYTKAALTGASYLSQVFGVSPLDTGVYKTTDVCFAALDLLENENQAWIDESIRFCADVTVLKALSNGDVSEIQNIALPAPLIDTMDELKEIEMGEVNAPYSVQNSINETIDIAHQDLVLDYPIVNLPSLGDTSLSLTLHYDTSEALKNDWGYRINYQTVHPNVITTLKTPYAEKTVDAGIGWSWNLPYIECVDIYTPDNIAYDYLSIHMPGGAVYNTDVDYNLYDEDLYAVRFYTSFGAFTNGNVLSVYTLIDEKTRTSYHFDEFGNLIGVEDRVGNSIKYRYQYAGATSYLTEVEDDLGRKITISRADTDDGRQITVTAPDGSQTKLNVTVDNGNSLLSSVTDPENKDTEFSYTLTDVQSQMEFNFYYSDGDIGRVVSPAKSNQYAGINKITYPTGAESIYEYYINDESAWANLPEDYLAFPNDDKWLATKRMWSSLKLANRKDCIGNDEYNEISYSGASDSAYDYGVTVTGINYRDTYRFNEFGYCYNETHQDNAGRNKIQKSVEFLVDSMYWVVDEDTEEGHVETTYYPLPAKITTTKSTTGVTPKATVTEEYEYIVNSGLFGEVTSYTINGRKTQYTYSWDWFNNGFNDTMYHRVPSTVKQYTGNNTYIQTNYTYTPISGMITSVESGISNDSNYPQNRTKVEYTYDAKGNVIKEEVYDTDGQTPVLVGKTEYNHTVAGVTVPYAAAVTIYDGANSVTSNYTYNLSNGRLTEFTDALGRKTTYGYDVMGRRISAVYADNSCETVAYAYPEKTITVDGVTKTILEQTAVHTDATGVQKMTRYDSLGREIGQYKKENGSWVSVSSITYGENGQVESQSDAYGNTTTYQYDGFGRVLKATNPDNTFSMKMYVDAVGNNASITESNNLTLQKYNELGELVTVSYYKSGSYVTLANYTYDKLGNLVKEHDAQGAITKYSYDAAGNMVKSEKYDAVNGDTVPSTGVQRYIYEYDALGNVTKTTDSNNHTTQNVYNGYGQLIQAIDGLGKIEYYEYDAVGNLAEKTDRSGDVFNYTYDSLNRQTSVTSGNSTISNTYDAAGRVLSVTSGSDTVSYAYSMQDGSLLSKTQGGKTVSYEYNRNGYLTSVEDFFEREVNYTYTNRGQTATAGDTSFTYNADSSVQSQSIGGYTQTYSYDERGLVTELAVTNSDDTTLFSESNTYNDHGNLTRTEYLFGEDGSDSTSGAHNYSYDIFGQLTGETFEKESALGAVTVDKTSSFAYDFAGNMTSNEGETNNVDANNRVTSTIEADLTTSTYTYDDDGNLIKKTYADGTSEDYQYDVWGHMTSYTNRDGVTTVYTYYADGLRKSKQTAGGDVTQYYYDGDVVINETVDGELSASNTVVGSRIVQIEEAGSTEAALIYNTHGDVALVLNINGGDPVRTYLYEAYGKVYSGYNASYNSPILYAGQYYDYESGMYYLRARYYSPDLKRFTQEDPIRDGMNWYAYCAGNPVKYVDPTGMVVEILCHSGTGLSNAYGHIDISVNGTVYSFASYFNKDWNDKFYNEGQILVIDRDIYINYRIDEGRTVTVYTLNFTDEQEASLENTLQSYIDTSEKPVGSDTYSGGLYYDPDDSSGIDKYCATGHTFGLNCVSFVMTALNDNMDVLLSEGKELPRGLKYNTNGIVYLPGEVQTALHKEYVSYMDKKPSLVKGVTTYRWNRRR